MIRTVWWKSKLFWTLLVVALYLLVGLLVVPPLVKSQLISTITAQTTLNPGVESVKFDPITFTLRLRNLDLREDDRSILDIDRVTVNFDPLSSLYRWDLSFGYIEINSPRVAVTRNQSGTINWARYRAGSDTSTESSTNTETLNYTVDQFSLKSGKIDLTDRLQAPDFDLTLAEINFNLKNLHLPSGGDSPLQLQSKIGNRGYLRARGTIYGDTRSVTANFRLVDLPLQKTNVHLRNIIRGEWETGRLDVQGTIRASASPLNINFAGKGRVTNPKLVDLDGNTLGGWKETTIDQIYVEWPRRKFRIGPIVIQSPYLTLKIDENSRTNLGQLLISQNPENTTVSRKQEISWSGSVGPIRIKSANLDFTDENIPGTFHTSMKELDGSIEAVSPAENDTAGVSLNGTLSDQSNLRLDGSISPFSFVSRSSIDMEIKNVGLPPLSPYSSEFIGYKIDRGKLLLNLDYRFEDGQLSAQNNAVLEEFTLGEYVGNQMIAIPMRLAVALLKDSNGVIRLDVPVSGNIKAPSFDFSRVIYQSVRSALTSIVKSPFSFLAGLVNAEPDELRFVEFEPTNSQLTEPVKNGLEKLAVIMKKRPLIKVGVRPGWTAADRQKFAIQALDNYLSREGDNPEELTESIPELESRFSKLTSPEALSEIRRKHTLEKGYITDTIDETAYARDLYERNLEKIEVDTDQLQKLAQKRASNIRQFLREREIQPERIFVLDHTELDTDKSDSIVKLPLTVEG